MNAILNQQCAIRLPAVDVERIKSFADQTMADEARPSGGHSGRFASWIRKAIVTQAKIDGLELEVLPNEIQRKRRPAIKQTA